MSKFALFSDPHIATPNPRTGWMVRAVDTEPTMYGDSVELLEAAITAINDLPDIDFVLCAGDLTKDSEPYNHDRVRELFTRFRKPLYCIPGNHDQPRIPKYRPPEYLDPDVSPVPASEIPRLYGDFGFKDTQFPAYSCDPTPDLHLVSICSSKPDEDRGRISPQVLAWLDDDLSRQRDPQRHTIVMLHHSIIDHVPGESVSPIFYWFHVENSAELKALLHKHRVRVTLSGHLHMQDVTEENGLYNVATASLAGYPHAYRVFEVHDGELQVRSHKLQTIPSRPDLQAYSHEYTADVFRNILIATIMGSPFGFARDKAERAADSLREFWPLLSAGDAQFDYSAEQVGDATLASFINMFSDRPPADNELTIPLR